MSSDNGLLLKHTENGWELREYCASYDQDFDKMYLHGRYSSAEEALRASERIYTEYGLRVSPTTPCRPRKDKS